MAFLSKTYLQDIRVEYPSQNDRDEIRVTQTGLLSAVMAMTISPNSVVSKDLIEKAKTSFGLNLDIPVMKKGVVTISNVRSCTIAGGNSESDLVRVVWKTLSTDIFMIPSQYGKNIIKYQHDLAKKIREAVEAFLVTIETDLDTALNANKTQVYGSTIVGTTYTLTGGAIQVPVSKQDFFFNDIAPINFADNFYEPTVRVICSHSVMSMVSKWGNQGTGNAINTLFQFPGKNFSFSNRITNGVGKTGTGYWMEDGSIGLLTRTDPDAMAALPASDGTEWYEMTLPGMPFEIGVMFKSKCSDQSLTDAGLAHLKSTRVENWQFSFDFGIVVPYNSDPITKAGVIRKFELVP